MRIVSRHLVGQFLAALAFSFVAFVGIFIVVNLVENLDTFIDRGIPTFQVAKYYVCYVPYIVVLTLPVAMLLASLFSVGQLARNNELCAMKASGLSLYQVLGPLFVLALGVSLFALVIGEKVVPGASGRAMRIKGGEGQAAASRADVFLRDEGGRIVSVRYYDAARKTARDVDISVGTPGQAALAERIVAKEMVWEKGAWVLRDGRIRRFVGDGEVITAFDTLRAGQLVTFVPSDFAKQRKRPEEMDYFELSAHIHKSRRSGLDPTRWVVERHLKLAFPFANLIIVLFGAPLSSTMRRTGKTVGFGLSLVVCFVYYGTVRTAQALGWNGVLPPFAAAWVGNIVFGGLGAVLLLKAPK